MISCAELQGAPDHLVVQNIHFIGTQQFIHFPLSWRKIKTLPRSNRTRSKSKPLNMSTRRRRSEQKNEPQHRSRSRQRNRSPSLRRIKKSDCLSQRNYRMPSMPVGERLSASRRSVGQATENSGTSFHGSLSPILMNGLQRYRVRFGERQEPMLIRTSRTAIPGSIGCPSSYPAIRETTVLR